MRRILITFCLISVSALGTFQVLADCGSYFQESPTTFNGSQCATAFSRRHTGTSSLPMGMKLMTYR